MSDEAGENEIQEEMDRVRGDLGGGIDRLGEQVRTLFDWQSYVRAAPLTSVALAAAAGYLIAPPIRSSRRYVTAAGEPMPSGPSLFGTLSNVLIATATQAASAYIGDMLVRELAAYSPPHPQPGVAPDAAPFDAI
ncbi:MAG: hypothetical protein JWN70_4892 [Planctomycetaceae bacterium]|nr:hypothetical protein [Planctomycetaceae bacterium]